MAQQALILTGDKKLDRALGKLPGKMQVKHIKKASRAGAKKVLERTRSLTPVDSGAMRKAYSVKATSRNITSKLGPVKTTASGVSYRVKKTVAKEFGAKVEISRKSLAKQTENLVKSGKRKRIYMESDQYFYPAFVELGGGGDSGKKPMRTALKQSSTAVLQEFKTELRRLVVGPFG